MKNNPLWGILGGIAAETLERAIPFVPSDPNSMLVSAVAAKQMPPETPTSIAQEQKMRMDRLVLVCMAMWSLLKEKTGVTEEELLKRVQEIDLSDGRLDGKVRHSPATCKSCARPMSPRHLKCIYCGAARADASAFDTAT